MSDEFLRKLYDMSGGKYKIFDRYKVGGEVGISNRQTDDFVDDLHNMGLIKKNWNNQNTSNFRRQTRG